MLLQGGGHGRRGFDPLERNLVSRPRELPDGKQSVVDGILDNQETKKRGHGTYFPRGAASFNNNQYSPSWRTASMNCEKSTGLRM